ncbi:MAG: DUF4352 domain-containing protein [Bryobacteraceae bacterium]|jgi:hypothetical protein
MLSRSPFLPLILLMGALAGCGSKGNSIRIDYPMGERVNLGPLTYNVVESVWRSQLGDAFKIRVPDQRFFMITISVTNGGGRDVSVPLLSLENSTGQSFLESNNGEGVDNWFGLLRNLSPAQTQQGRILFDVPLTSYRLRLTDGGEPGSERYAWVDIPLRLDTDSGVEGPTPGNSLK